MRPSVLSRILAVAAAIACCPGAAADDEWPTLRQGMWEFRRTVGGNAMAPVKKCTQPADDMRRQNEILRKGGCKLAPMKRSGNTYTLRSECTGPVTASQTSVLTVASDGDYRIEVRGTVDGAPTTETLVARRIGDCAR
jgi:hypothetical protein